MVTEEAMAERRAALEGDPGTDTAVKINMPHEPSIAEGWPVEEPVDPLQTSVGIICT